MATEQWTNNPTSTLASGIDASVTSVTVATGDGALFPAVGNFRFRVDSEIMLCTARSGDVLTVTRGQESTTAASHSSGALCGSPITAGAIAALKADTAASISFLATREVQTATNGQTAFTLSTMTYTPGTNCLRVIVGGVEQPSSAYTETSTTVVTMSAGVAAGVQVEFEARGSAGSSLNPTYQSITSTGKVDLYTTQGGGWIDILGEPQVRTTGANSPTWSQINSTDFWNYKFAVNDAIWFEYHFPHEYAPGTDVYIHTHWIPDGTNTNSVRWEYKYSYAKGHNQAAFDLTGTVITATQTVGGTQYQHYITESAAISNPNFEVDGILSVRVRRVTNGGTDNTNGIFMKTCDLHCQANTVATKNRAPNFYT